MKTTICLLCAAMFVCVGTTALADEKEDTTIYTFEDDVVEGATFLPEEAKIQSRARDKQRSLVKVRTHFVPEMFKSVENI